MMTDMVSTANQKEAQEQFLSLPEDVFAILFDEVTVNGVTTPAADQMQTLQILGSLDESDTEAMSAALSSLPETVCQALYTDIVIEDVTISGDDQIQMMQIFPAWIGMIPKQHCNRWTIFRILSMV